MPVEPAEVLTLPVETDETTTWKTLPSDTGSEATGSNVPANATLWSVVGNIASGRMHLDWANLWTVVGAIMFLAAIVFVFILYFRDNELGRLETPLGFRQFGFKALGVLIPTIIILGAIGSFVAISRRNHSKSS